MHKTEKERLVAELTERLKSSETLIVADYRGLTMPEIDALRGELLEHGARFQVVKNTLTRRAAEAAGQEALLALLDGPSAIAFLEADGDMVAAAKALAKVARDTKVLTIRGGVLQGRPISNADVEELAKLPPFDVLRSQVLGAITAPLTTLVGLFSAPLQNLIGLIDARIEQLEGQGDTSRPASAEAAAEPPAEETPAEDAAVEAPGEEPPVEAAAAEEATAEAEPEADAPEPAAETAAATTEATSDEASGDEASSDQATSDTEPQED
jgi:large subunit ribosomal protein L10